MKKQQEEVETIREYNCILLTNLMPDHVVNHFLTLDVRALVRELPNHATSRGEGYEIIRLRLDPP